MVTINLLCLQAHDLTFRCAFFSGWTKSNQGSKKFSILELTQGNTICESEQNQWNRKKIISSWNLSIIEWKKYLYKLFCVSFSPNNNILYYHQTFVELNFNSSSRNFYSVNFIVLAIFVLLLNYISQQMQPFDTF